MHATLAALGLSTLLRTAAGLYTVVKRCGAAYLVFLGVQAFWLTRQAAADHGQGASDPPVRAIRGGPPSGRVS